MGSLVDEPTYLSHVSAAFFDRIITEMATILLRAYSAHPNSFVP